MHSTEEKLKAFERLLHIMDELREKCPWDREQTLDSLRNLTIEETYELADAIMDQDLEEIRKELGDLILHIVFYAKIGSEKGAFDIADVLNGINSKLVFRHPHVFGERIDPSRQNRDLHLGRTCVAVRPFEFLDQFLLFFRCNGHTSLPNDRHADA